MRRRGHRSRAARCQRECRRTGASCAAAAWRASWPLPSWPDSMRMCGTPPRCCCASTRGAALVGSLLTACANNWPVELCQREGGMLNPICEHSRDLSATRQEALQQTLEAAATQMSPEERVRPGPGPPPLLAFVRALPLVPALRPCPVAVAPSDASSSEGLEAGRLPGSISPFIYNPTRVRPGLRPGCAAPFHEACTPYPAALRWACRRRRRRARSARLARVLWPCGWPASRQAWRCKSATPPRAP